MGYNMYVRNFLNDTRYVMCTRAFLCAVNTKSADVNVKSDERFRYWHIVNIRTLFLGEKKNGTAWIQNKIAFKILSDLLTTKIQA